MRCVETKNILNVFNYKCEVRRLIGKANVVFDPVRKRYVQFTPEEWVRQYMLDLLSKEYSYPLPLVRVEKLVRSKPVLRKGRADIIFCNSANEPLLLVECKAPEERLNTETLYQISRYNKSLQARFLLITNGLDFCCWEKTELNGYLRIDFIPRFGKQ